MTEAPPKPYHRWRSNEDIDFNVHGDYCLACGVKRWTDDPAKSAKAAGPCPQGEPIPADRMSETIPELVARTRAEQGLPRYVEDPAAINRVVDILRLGDEQRERRQRGGD